MTEKSQETQEKFLFTVFYDSEDNDLQQHRLPAEDFAKAVMAMNKLFEDADKILFPRKNTVDLYVTAPVIEGSVGMEFVALLNDPAAYEIIKTLGLTIAGTGVVGGVIHSLFTAAKKVKDFATIEVTYSEDDDSNESEEATIKIGDKTLPVTREVAKLIERPNIRKHLYDVIAAPVKDLTNPSFSIGTVDKSEIYTAYDTKEINRVKGLVKTETKDTDYHFDTTATFSKVNFESNKGWVMRFEDQSVPVEIEDEQFLKRVETNRETFGSKEEYTVHVKRVKSFTAAGKVQFKFFVETIEKKKSLI